MRKELKIPKFKSENQERKFWSNLDLSEHFSAKDFSNVSFAELKPTSRSISLRLPEYMLTRLKEEAHALSIPYQSLIKQYIAKGILED